MSEAPTQPRRRWFQFSILSLLVLTAVVAVLFAMVVVPARRQRNAVAAILDLGGQVGYDYQAAPGATAPPAPAWLRKLFGDDCFQTVTSVGLVSKEFEDPDKITAALEQTAMLPNVDALGIDAAGLRDDHALQIARLQSFTRLRLAWYAAGQFTGAGVARLKNLTELHTLALEGAISDAELPAVGKLTQLRSLGLGGTVSDAGMEHLLPLFNLEHLDCRVDSRAARVLAALAEPTELELEDVGSRAGRTSRTDRA